ncbi:hypothetical protein G6F55_014496 [Rhizopus delemar]|nr:hypothetical protein G6F55_014496 [Rhizopus delemar]
MLASTVQGPSRWPGAYASAGRPSTESKASGECSPAITPRTTTSGWTAPGESSRTSGRLAAAANTGRTAASAGASLATAAGATADRVTVQ